MVCCQSDPLQLSESQWNHYIWGVCSANWWDALKTATPAASIGQQKEPNSSLRKCCISHNQCFKNGMNWTTEFCFICHIHLTSRQPTTASWQLFVCKMLPWPVACRNAFQQFIKSLSMDFFFFFAIGINKLISHWQNVLIVMFPILINKDVFVLLIIILKSRVQKLYYFCTYNAGNPALISRLGRSPRGWIGYPLQYS